MAWYHIFQYAEVRDPLYPQLRRKALPIARYEIQGDKILAVELSIGATRMWFPRGMVRLYKASTELITVPESRGSVAAAKKFLKKMGLKR